MIFGLILVKYSRIGIPAQIYIFLMHISVKVKFSEAILQNQKERHVSYPHPAVYPHCVDKLRRAKQAETVIFARFAPLY
jgi:hypothetical protein